MDTKDMTAVTVFGLPKDDVMQFYLSNWFRRFIQHHW